KCQRETTERELEITKLTTALQEKGRFKPFEITAISSVPYLAANADLTEQCLAANNHIVDCNIEIRNPNPTQPISSISVRLLKIEPPLEHIPPGQRILERII